MLKHGTSLTQAVPPAVSNVSWPEDGTTESAHLILLHHLPDSTAFLADDVAMKLVRHLHVLRYGHQRLNEESVRRPSLSKKKDDTEKKTEQDLPAGRL